MTLLSCAQFTFQVAAINSVGIGEKSPVKFGSFYPCKFLIHFNII